MKKNKYIKKAAYLLAVFSIAGSSFVSCTDDFAEMNTDPNGVINVSVESYLSEMQQSIYDNFENTNWSYQLQQNLNADVYSGYMMPPTPFAGGQNNTNYALVAGWNNRPFDVIYTQVMKPFVEIEKNAKLRTDILAVAQILKVAGMSRTTDIYGPLPYSTYGSGKASAPYDSQESIYMSFFEDLKTATDTLTNIVARLGTDSKPLATSDMIYNGDYTKWIKFGNSLRLRLAMRIVKVNPEKAKTEAEAACSQQYGVFVLNSDLAAVSNGDSKVMNPLNVISHDYNDIRMGAPMESILVGYDDPRIKQYFTVSTVVPTKYKGIRNGIDIVAKGDYVSFSNLGARWTYANRYDNPLPLMFTAEVSFLRAEGKLRGWNVGSETAEQYYEQGIQLSFDQWGVTGTDTYLADATSKAIPYVDPVNSKNDVPAGSPSLSTITIKWNSSDSNESQLERIMTQKWIAMFPNGAEAWSEYRRTGYPVLFPVVVNYSDGTISTEEGIRRLPFPNSEYTNNREETTKAAQFLSGPDTGGTRLWWDVKKGNF